MPQHSLFKNDFDATGMRVEIVDRTPELIPWWEVTWFFRGLDGDWTRYTTIALTGIEVDYLDTICTEALNAWAYGDRSDVLRAITRTHRAARKHRKSHEHDD